jgi:hypothetical protein
MVTFANIDYYLEHDSPEGHLYFKQFADNSLLLAELLKNEAQKATIEGVMSHSATIITETFLQGKIIGHVGTLFGSAFSKAQKIVNATKNELLPATEVLVATAEGIEVAVAKQTLPLLKNEVNTIVKYSKEIEAIFANETESLGISKKNIFVEIEKLE